MTERFIQKDSRNRRSRRYAVENFSPTTNSFRNICSAAMRKPIGSRALHCYGRGAADGKLYVKGEVVTFEVPHLLEYTVIDPNNPALADIPENYLMMSFIVNERAGNASTLEIKQGDFTAVANGEQRYNDTVGGDDFVLVGIKKLAEAQAKH